MPAHPPVTRRDVSRYQRRDPFERKASGLFSRAKRLNGGRPNGWVSGRQLRLLLDEAGWVCAYCGCPLTLATVTYDHKQPLSRGGRHAAANLLPACRSCNASKGTLTDQEFRLYRAVRALPPTTQAEVARQLAIYGLTRLLAVTGQSKQEAA